MEDSSASNIEDWRSVAEDRRHRAQGSANWSDREDWGCDSFDYDGMDGFDSYYDNDF
ncbi:MAG: hypothetical protein NC229_04960 [Bacteroides sp.]|nr:hypothetical protein [Bacteroidales bacterium]MCM1069800.1 hypothetical protein [Prevotella sp.]MCM1354006.1 hypothetical protein [Bacteroides sp.]